MKIRLLSDLHLDINRKYEIDIPNNYDYTLIAGDLGGDYKANAKWIRENVHRGAFVSGNHDAYTHDNTPVDDVKEYYHENFPLDGPITYFDDDVGVLWKDLDEKTVLVADVLYTDYKLKTLKGMDKMPVKKRIERNMFLASPKFSGSYMNDFNFFTRRGTYEKSEINLYDRTPSGCYYIKPENYKRHFDSAFRKITKIIEDNGDKNVILMTHHCLSPGCISDDFSHDSLNGSYVSDKTSWIRKHPNIKLILSGHVHYRFDFMVGKTRYVTNPLGYLRDFQNVQFNFETNEKEFWTPNLFIDTETWEVSKEPYDNGKWDKEQSKGLMYTRAFI